MSSNFQVQSSSWDCCLSTCVQVVSRQPSTSRAQRCPCWRWFSAVTERKLSITWWQLSSQNIRWSSSRAAAVSRRCWLNFSTRWKINCRDREGIERYLESFCFSALLMTKWQYKTEILIFALTNKPTMTNMQEKKRQPLDCLDSARIMMGRCSNLVSKRSWQHQGWPVLRLPEPISSKLNPCQDTLQKLAKCAG